MKDYLYAVVAYELFYDRNANKFEWVLGRVLFKEYDSAVKYMAYPFKCFEQIKEITTDRGVEAQSEDPIINIELIDLMD